MSRGLPILTVLMAWLMLGGCARKEPAPVEAVATVYSALAEYSSRGRPGLLEAAYDHLDSGTRAKLQARAKEASAATGVEVQPWELLGARGMVGGDRVSDVELVSQTGDEARVSVKFAWWVPEQAGGKPLQPEPVEVKAVREEGQWRVVLPLPL